MLIAHISLSGRQGGITESPLDHNAAVMLPHISEPSTDITVITGNWQSTHQ